MTRREFVTGAASAAGLAASAGCRCTCGGACGDGARILFGACRPLTDAKLMASVGFDFWEWGVAQAFQPESDGEWWKRQRDLILAQPIPLRSCNGFLPGKFRLTGPKADFAPALKYAETALRRAEEAGVKTVVFGSGGARNVPGDICGDKDQKPLPEKGVEQYTDFCRQLCAKVSDLKTVQIVIEPLRPNESNIINYVWQGLQIVEDVNSSRLRQLADIFHMMMGRESAESIVKAGARLKHCHIASYETRRFPGSDPATVWRFKPYFDALKAIGYTGGVSCECGWGKKDTLAKDFETALKTMKGLI